MLPLVKKLFQFISILLLTFVLPGELDAQITFEITYGPGSGSTSSRGKYAIQTPDSGYIFTGSYLHASSWLFSASLVKADRFGNVMWRRRYDAGNGIDARFVEPTPSGGYVLFTEQISGTLYRAGIINVNASGSIQWERYYSGDRVRLMYGTQTTDGGYILAVTSTSTSPGSQSHAVLIKTNSTGVPIWEKAYGSGTGIGRVVEIASGGYMFFGSTANFGAGGADSYLVRTDSAGDTLWTKIFGTPGMELGRSLIKTLDGGYLLTGLTDTSSSGMYGDAFLLKLDSNANVVWSKTYASQGMEDPNQIIQLSDSSFVMVADRIDLGPNYVYNGLLMKFDVAGNLLWNRVFMDDDGARFYSVEQTFDNGFILAGNGSNGQALYIKTDSNGRTYCNEDSISFITSNFSFIEGSGGAASTRTIFNGTGISSGQGWMSPDIGCLTNFPATVLATHNVCMNGFDGTLTITNVGGIPPHTFLWSTGDSTQNLTGLAAGEYSVTITDSTSLSSEFTLSVNAPDSMIESGLSSVGTPCGLCVGQAIASPSKGYPPYTYQWYNGDSSQTSAALCTGYELLEITDSINCQLIDSVLITELSPIQLSTGGIPDNDVSSLGKAFVIVKDGIPPYTYLWSDASAQTTDTASGLISGVYRVTIMDANGCTDSSAVLVQDISGGQVTFVKSYGSWNWEYGGDVIAVNDGYVFSGETSMYGAGDYDIYLMKTDLYGNQLWYRNFGGLEEEKYYDITVTSDGGFVLIGTTESFGFPVGGSGRDIYLVRTDGNGDTLWTRAIGTTSGDMGYQIEPTSDGGFALLGTLGSDLSLIKIDSMGIPVWHKSYDPVSGSVGGTSLDQTVDGGYLISGGGYINGYGFGIHLIKTLDNGDTLWTGFYGGQFNDYLADVIVTSDGNYLVVGSTQSFLSTGYDLYIIKIDPNGSVLWAKQYGGNSNESGSSVIEAQNGDYIILGSSESFGSVAPESATIYLLRVDNNGNIVWSNVYGGEGNNYGHSVKQADDLGFIISGTTSSFGAGSQDPMMIKTDSLGNAPCITYSVSSVVEVVSSLIYHDMIVTNDTSYASNTNTQITDTSTVNCGSCFSISNIMGAVICKGGASGSIDISVSGAVPPYTYTWSNGANTENISGVSAGKYEIIVEDRNGCRTFDTIMVSEPALALSLTATVTNDLVGTNEGSIVANPSGGVPPYAYSWSTGETTSTIDSLAEGQYTLQLTDNAGCQASANYSILTGVPIKFQKVIGGDTLDIARAVAQTYDGGYIVAGATKSYGQGQEDVYLIKLDATGSITWSKTYGTPAAEVPRAVIQTPDSGYVVYGFGGYVDPTFMIKTNSQGDTLWTRTFANDLYESGWKLVQTMDSGFVTASNGYNGITYGAPSITKLNALGDTSWVRTVSFGNQSNYVDGIMETSDTNYLMPVGISSQKICLVKLDKNGNLLWVKRYEVAGGSGAVAISETADGNYVIGGYAHNGVPNPGVYILKIDTAGDVLWSKSFSPPSGSTGTYPNDMKLDADDNLVITGRTNNFGAPFDDVFILKITSDGAGLWANIYGGWTSDDIAYSIATTSDGGYVAVGETESFTPGQKLMYMIKTDNNGGSGGCNEYGVSLSGFNLTTTSIDYPVTVTQGGNVGFAASTSTNPVDQDSIICLSCIAIQASQTSPSCSFGNDGSIALTLFGGASPYSFVWSTGDSTQNIGSLAAGSYDVTVMGAAGCTDVKTIQVAESASVSIGIEVFNVTCKDSCDGQIKITISGGIMPYTYYWNDPSAQTDSVAVNLCPGSYEVVIVDAIGDSCSASSSISESDSSLAISLSAVVPSCDTCSNGSASAVASGGTTPYSYNWNDSFAQTTQTATGLTGGIYSVTITDANGCSVTAWEEVLKTSKEQNSSGKYMIYPNPSSGSFVLYAKVVVMDKVNIKLFNSIGQCVYNKSETFNTGENTHQMDLGHLAPGLYELTIQGESEVSDIIVLIQ